MKGSCLCGAIEYEVDQLDMPISHCHCRTCRKAHAAAFAPTAGVTPAERQRAMVAELQDLAPVEFAARYREGIEHWRDQEKMQDHDRWVSVNESICDAWLFDLLIQNRKELGAFYA